MIKARFLLSCGFVVITGWVIIIIATLMVKTIGNGYLDWLIFRVEIEEGEIIIEQVESFRYIHNRIPTDEEFVSILKRPSVSLYRGEDKCPCYSPHSNSYDYTISFPGVDIGDTFSYNSKIGTWQRRGS